MARSRRNHGAITAMYRDSANVMLANVTPADKKSLGQYRLPVLGQCVIVHWDDNNDENIIREHYF